jgi:hypothetical protein
MTTAIPANYPALMATTIRDSEPAEEHDRRAMLCADAILDPTVRLPL